MWFLFDEVIFSLSLVILRLHFFTRRTVVNEHILSGLVLFDHFLLTPQSLLHSDIVQVFFNFLGFQVEPTITREVIVVLVVALFGSVWIFVSLVERLRLKWVLAKVTMLHHWVWESWLLDTHGWSAVVLVLILMVWYFRLRLIHFSVNPPYILLLWSTNIQLLWTFTLVLWYLIIALHLSLIGSRFCQQLLLVVTLWIRNFRHMDMLGLVPWRRIHVTFHVTVPVVRVFRQILQSIKKHVLACLLRQVTKLLVFNRRILQLREVHLLVLFIKVIIERLWIVHCMIGNIYVLNQLLVESLLLLWLLLPVLLLGVIGRSVRGDDFLDHWGNLDRSLHRWRHWRLLANLHVVVQSVSLNWVWCLSNHLWNSVRSSVSWGESLRLGEHWVWADCGSTLNVLNFVTNRDILTQRKVAVLHDLVLDIWVTVTHTVHQHSLVILVLLESRCLALQIQFL